MLHSSCKSAALEHQALYGLVSRNNMDSVQHVASVLQSVLCGYIE